MNKPLRVGVDFDNTIVSYDKTFFRVARRLALIPADLPRTKTAVRDHLRSAGREDDWTRLQGLVYGEYMREAEPFEDVLAFFESCHRWGIQAFIVSHRTRYPYLGERTDLHQAAREWIATHGVSGDGRAILPAERVFFELSMDEKLERIRMLDLNVFVDDLPEFLLRADFPETVARILFDPAGSRTENRLGDDIVRATSWRRISEIIRSMI